MFLSNASVKRPVAMSCLIIALALLGINAYRKLGLELMPKMDIPYVTVLTTYPGATPADVEVDIAKKIEDAVASIDGLKHITSSCQENLSQITLEFHLGTDINVAATDVREKINAIVDDLPQGADTISPKIFKVDINAQEIVTMALTGDVGIEELYDYVDQELRDKLASIPGVGEVRLTGGTKREVHILLDREEISAAGLASTDIVSAVKNGIVNIPAGRIKDRYDEYNVKFDGEYDYINDINTLVVAGKNGSKRYIKDLGTVEMGAEERRQAAFIDGKPAIGIQIVKKADANAVEVVRKVKSELKQLSDTLPGGMRLIWAYDDGDFIESSFKSTSSNIVDGVILTALILFFFIFNIRSTFVVAISMPLTILISIFLMQLAGYTFNNSTLMAIGLSVGVLVTNSIVVLESILGHFEAGATPWEAAKNGTGDVAIAVMASAGTNMVVLLPIGMMGSMVGMFFAPFALTTLFVNIVSLFISFTLTPILSGLLLKKQSEKNVLVKISAWWNSKLDGVARKLVAVIRLCSKKRRYCAILIMASGILLVYSLTLVKDVGFSMFPKIDRDLVIIKLEYPTQQNLERTIERVAEIENQLKVLPGLEHMFTTVGKIQSGIARSSEGTYIAGINLKFTDKTKRETSIFEFAEQARKILENHTDCIASVSTPGLVGGEDLPIQMTISGTDLTELENIALFLKKQLEKNKNFVSPDTSVRDLKTEITIVPKRAEMHEAGIAPQALGYVIRTNVEGTKSGLYKSGARSYDIRVKFRERAGKDQVPEFMVPLKNEETVLLNQYADIIEKKAAIQITRYDKQRISMLYSHLADNYPLGNALQYIDSTIEKEQILPPGYTRSFIGQAEMMAESFEAFLEAGIIAIVLTYLTLSAILESFTRPFYILTTLPMGLIGIMWALKITNTSINIFVLLGAVMLVGIVVNNAVLIIDKMQQLIDNGLPNSEAILQAVALEFRPVLMITLAAILGMLPLAVATGLGSELTTPIGIASVGGILVSAILSLIILPVIYLFFHRPPKENTITDTEAYNKARSTSTRISHRGKVEK